MEDILAVFGAVLGGIVVVVGLIVVVVFLGFLASLVIGAMFSVLF